MSLININISDKLKNIAAYDNMRLSFIYKLNPASKIIASVFFIVTVASFGRYEITALLPYAAYPIFISQAAYISLGKTLKKTLIALPFAAFIAVFALFYDTQEAVLGPFVVRAGLLSFISVLLKFTLTMTAAILLLATTGLDKLAAGLNKLRAPKIFVSLLLMTYRYIALFLEEFISTIRCYELRGGRLGAISLHIFGSLTAQSLIRAHDRSSAVLNAMLLRGGNFFEVSAGAFSLYDKIYLCATIFLCLFFRFVNLPEFLGSVIFG